MRTRALATTALLLTVVTGCGDDGAAPAVEPSEPAASSEAPSPSVTRAQAAIGHAFRAFARGGPLPRLADDVDLYLGNAFTGVVTRPRARDRRAWATCTELGAYAARTCPLSPLVVLRQHARVSYADRPQGLCMPTYSPVPPDLRKLERVVIVPAEGSIEMCAQNFAIQLFTDRGELVAVSTLIGEP